MYTRQFSRCRFGRRKSVSFHDTGPMFCGRSFRNRREYPHTSISTCFHDPKTRSDNERRWFGLWCRTFLRCFFLFFFEWVIWWYFFPVIALELLEILLLLSPIRLVSIPQNCFWARIVQTYFPWLRIALQFAICNFFWGNCILILSLLCRFVNWVRKTYFAQKTSSSQHEVCWFSSL